MNILYGQLNAAELETIGKEGQRAPNDIEVPAKNTPTMQKNNSHLLKRQKIEDTMFFTLMDHLYLIGFKN